MKRWFIARMGEYEAPGEIVPKVNLYHCNSRIWSRPSVPWCFGQLATNNVTQMDADPDIYIIPDAALDNLVSSLSPAVRTTLSNKLAAAGFVTTDIKNTWTIRQVLGYLKTQLGETATVEDGDVTDIEA